MTGIGQSSVEEGDSSDSEDLKPKSAQKGVDSEKIQEMICQALEARQDHALNPETVDTELYETGRRYGYRYNAFPDAVDMKNNPL